MAGSIQSNSPLDQNVVIKKIEKRLRNILTSHDVSEITFPNNQVEVGKARVVETRELLSDTTPGTILDICRKGYQRNDKVLRPADVVTAKDVIPRKKSLVNTE
ncbi:MAG: nucleotide exchange factor GrpE [Gammaproteobacteria bacterium RIFCSPHIGHO2_12_FULL_40_19]|nr:MAG: nucleotide exchange factor GrpE [Gammaproteobacteria bacterium RIFCSPHIGHO2_12_FULL_40_19]